MTIFENLNTIEMALNALNSIAPLAARDAIIALESLRTKLDLKNKENYDPVLLDRIFGPGKLTNIDERARASTKIYVCSTFQISEYSPKATGRCLTSWEAYRTYGLDILVEIEKEGQALLPGQPSKKE